MLVVAAGVWPFVSAPPLVAYADKASVCGTPGMDGPATLGNATVNTYYPGTAADLTAGSTSIPVGAPTGSALIQAGDLLLIIQMQGADINSDNSGAYGDGVPLDPAQGNLGANYLAGQYEYVVATSAVVGGAVSISSPLVNSYGTQNYPVGAESQGQRRYQVVRVPQYSSLTLTGAVTAVAWNGSIGGVVAMDVAGGLTFSGGSVNVSGQGFRGGGGLLLTGGGGANTDYLSLSTGGNNASKGEGYAGTPRYIYDSASGLVIDTGAANEGYPNGSFARGAPGNAGGGGTDGNPAANDDNSGGGGGGDGGIGGRGGNSWRSNLPVGGYGGDDFSVGAAPSYAASRLVIGGGGGAGTINNNNGALSSGGAGGGIVMIRAGAISGNGSITASGADAPGQPLNDSGGGGGAGGSVLVVASNSALPAGLNVSSNGGRGGDAWPGQAEGAVYPGARHGPGGGGAGGVVFLSSAAGTVTATGGDPGFTTAAKDTYGAFAGGDGVINTSTTPANVTNGISGAGCLPVLTVVKTTSTPGPMTVPNTATYTITVTNAAGRAAATGVSLRDVLPIDFTYASNSNPVYAGGASGPATISNSGTLTTPVFGVAGGNSTNSFTIPGGGSVTITFVVDVGGSVAPGTYQNPAQVNYTDPTRTVSGQTVTPGGSYASGGGTAPGSNYDPASSTGEDVTIASTPGLTMVKTAVPGTYDTGGDVISYSYSVTNSGNVTLSGPFTVADDRATDEACPAAGSLAPGASIACTASYTITQADLDAGSVTNTATAGGSFAGNPVTSPADSETVTLTVVGPPSISKAFSPSAISVGGTSTLTFTVTNANAGTALTGVGFSDSLPTGVEVASTPNASTSGCGTPTFSPGAGDLTLTFSGGTIAGGGTCTVAVDVTGTTVGTKNNITGNVTSTNGGTGNTASDTLTVVGPPSISKAFAPASISVGGTSALTFTVTNPNAGTALTGVAFTDTLPSGLTVASSTSSECGGTLTVTAPDGIALSGGTIGAGGSCSFDVTVTGSTAGTKNNITGNVTSTNGGTGNTASDTLTVVGPPSISKAFAPAAITVGGTSTLTFTLTNPPANIVALTGLAFSDAYPAGLVNTTPLSTTNSCGGSLTAAPGGSSISLSGATIPVDSSCTVIVDVSGTTVGAKANTSGTVSSTNGGTGNTASDTLTVTQAAVVDPAVTKSVDPAAAQVGDTVTFTLVVTNNGDANADGVVVRDVIPAFLDISTITISATEPSVSTVGNTITINISTVSPTDVYTVTITTVVNNLGAPPGGTNAVNLTTTSTDVDLMNNVDSVAVTIVAVPRLGAPATGFAPNRRTPLPAQAENEAYRDYGELWLEIPSLGVETEIVGVPLDADGWDVTWLWDQAGYLNGTAFPTWSGNSVITGHVTLPSGLPGPFARLRSLRYGDRIVVHGWGTRYIYEVREVEIVRPDAPSVFQHEERSWITLLTCTGYDERSETYRWRLAVRAVLVEVGRR